MKSDEQKSNIEKMKNLFHGSIGISKTGKLVRQPQTIERNNEAVNEIT